MDYRNFLNELNSCNLGYRRPECFGMNLLCGYYSIDHSQYERLKRMGELLCGIFKKIYGLYGDAILNNNEEVLNLFETGTLRSKVMRRLHRQMFVRGSGNLPLIFRMDSPDGEHCVDCHVGFRGMGYIYALRNVAQRYKSRQVLISKLCSVSVEASPMPQNFSTGVLPRISSRLFSLIIAIPFGLLILEANFANKQF